MLRSQETTIRAAVEPAIARGVDEKEIHRLVADIANAQQERPTFNLRGERVFDEVPKGLIPLPKAARRYDIPRRTLVSRVRSGILRSYGRVKASARGGGYILINEEQLQHQVANPPRKGRPRVK